MVGKSGEETPVLAPIAFLLVRYPDHADHFGAQLKRHSEKARPGYTEYVPKQTAANARPTHIPRSAAWHVPVVRLFTRRLLQNTAITCFAVGGGVPWAFRLRVIT